VAVGPTSYNSLSRLFQSYISRMHFFPPPPRVTPTSLKSLHNESQLRTALPDARCTNVTVCSYRRDLAMLEAVTNSRLFGNLPQIYATNDSLTLETLRF
jgi:hypothetical protein